MWTSEQDRALKAIDAWFREGSTRKQVFKLFGYAGTGKTTMARHIAQHIPGTVKFAAFSGKAANVLTNKGCPANTIHSLIYAPIPKSKKYIKELQDEIDSTEDSVLLASLKEKMNDLTKNHRVPMWRLKSPDEAELDGVSLIIIDECSMVGKRMGEDLLYFGIPILVLGDPGQLPPIGDAGYFTKSDPDFLLTEIHRQAHDNPILHLSTLARMNKPIQPHDYGNGVLVKSRKEICAQEVLSCDQILLGRNETRRMWNARIRQHKFGGDPINVKLGDKIICLKNNHNLGLMNGSLWTVEDELEFVEDNVYAKIKSVEDGKTSCHVLMYDKIFKGQQMQFWEYEKDINEFDFGYTITVHKSQGSQWDKVMVLDESRSFMSNKQNWLYTAITRAAEELTLLL